MLFRSVAGPDVNLPLCHTPSSYQPLHQVANMNNRSGIKYPRATRYVSKVNVYNICNKCTFARRCIFGLLAMLCKPLATVPLPMTGLLAVIANGLRVRFRLRCNGGGYRLRALCLSLFLGPTLLELSRFLHHQHLMCSFLNILLCHFEHPMQFSELLIHAMHMIVRDERPIAGRKRT